MGYSNYGATTDNNHSVIIMNRESPSFKDKQTDFLINISLSILILLTMSLIGYGISKIDWN